MEVDENALNDFFNTQDIDAVLCVNEILAIHCMSLVKKKEMKISEDISFIGFTDGILSKYADPTLTAVAQHGVRMGEVAASMLIERFENEDEEKEFVTRVIKTELIERDSTI